MFLVFLFPLPNMYSVKGKALLCLFALEKDLHYSRSCLQATFLPSFYFTEF